MRRQRDATGRAGRAHHVDAAEFMHLMTMGGSSAIPPRAPAAPPRSPGSSTWATSLSWLFSRRTVKQIAGKGRATLREAGQWRMAAACPSHANGVLPSVGAVRLTTSSSPIRRNDFLSIVFSCAWQLQRGDPPSRVTRPGWTTPAGATTMLVTNFPSARRAGAARHYFRCGGFRLRPSSRSARRYLIRHTTFTNVPVEGRLWFALA